MNGAEEGVVEGRRVYLAGRWKDWGQVGGSAGVGWSEWEGRGQHKHGHRTIKMTN